MPQHSWSEGNRIYYNTELFKRSVYGRHFLVTEESEFKVLKRTLAPMIINQKERKENYVMSNFSFQGNLSKRSTLRGQLTVSTWYKTCIQDCVSKICGYWKKGRRRTLCIFKQVFEVVNWTELSQQSFHLFRVVVTATSLSVTNKR